MKKNNVVDFEKAEKNARLRDFEVEKKKFKQSYNDVSQEQLEEALQVVSRATGKEHYIGTKKSSQSKVRFAQQLQENLGFLNKKKYLTGREKIFLQDIIPYIAFETNCIVLDIKAKNPVPASITEIGELINSSRQNVSAVINSLKRKGIIAKAESGIEGNNAKAYAIFINPHVVYTGDKDNVNEALQVMFRKAMKMPVLRDLPDRLF
uniref:Rep protein n=1 Tax=Heyndrickxia coagulans TaxID=1398 RepID=A0FJY1_HEYCO|nr:helix-turn-helix domain-containing protein [Heyndrickxia coagulans]ABJ99986.1 Rep protein [Heyndrickxia coagulans]